ncbi:M23 family metallopeptidase [Chitinivibrio alkaliphilus]|uniref:Peptidase, M23 family n=1 Tax=Chitinivibrio alkaliphilus ACht1 TaxID=1313304 RepID=U7D7Q9_9BACT|nr:M23 family metallopeptidase [Chitinivibrio alkaliphilus]ERP31611.1 peptidase, M23 family [Chitinivibrio alkaliphilus ACht1]
MTKIHEKLLLYTTTVAHSRRLHVVLLCAVLFVAADIVYAFVGYKTVRAQYSSANRSLHFLRSDLTRMNDELHDRMEQLGLLEEREGFFRLKYGLADIDEGVRDFSTGGKPTMESFVQERLGSKDHITSDKLLLEAESFLQRVRFTDSMFVKLQGHIDREIMYYNEIPSVWPVRRNRITSPYGRRTHPVTGRRSFHDGIDIAGSIGDSIIAPADGIVTYVGRMDGYGKTIEIRHRNSGYYTRYAHLSGFNTQRGNIVRRGDLIGFVGNTGTSTGPHLHYEVRRGERWGATQNPWRYLPRKDVVYD